MFFGREETPALVIGSFFGQNLGGRRQRADQAGGWCLVPTET